MTTVYHAEDVIRLVREQIEAARRALLRIETECDLADDFGDLEYVEARIEAIGTLADRLDRADHAEKIREAVHQWAEQRAAAREDVRLESDQKAAMRTYL